MGQKAFPEYDLYIAPDGTEFKFGANDRFVLGRQGYGMPPIEFIRQSGPFQHGETFIDFRLQSRTIQWVVRQNGHNRFDHWDNRAALLDTFRINRQSTGQFAPGKLRKLLPDGSMRDLDVFLAFGPDFPGGGDEWDEFGFTDTLRFIAPDPTFYDPTLRTLTWALDPNQTNLTFPITFPITFGYTYIDDTNQITYNGTWQSFPTITITGPLKGFDLTNDDTSERLVLNYQVNAGETVTFDLSYGNKTITSDVAGNILGALTPGSDLATFHIAPDPEASGGVNNFSLYGIGASSATQVVLTYYDRYLGI